jgi:tRNA threonylcarbamoyladenosine biosynthesis protein TsaB
VALAWGENLVRARDLNEARRHARDLVPVTAELLAAEGWRPRDLHGVLVSRGPGSYTGLRVGIMSAKALAYATGCALLAVDTFAVIARQAPPEANCLDVVADAQQGKLYVQRFARPEPKVAALPTTGLSIQKGAEWLSLLGPAVWVSGPGLRLYGSQVPPGVRVTDPALWDPRPESLLQIGLARYQRGERDDLWKLEPLYLRPSSAEEKGAQRSAT